MSSYSGVCDLADHIFNLSTIDEMECFEDFKRKTGGIIYQEIPLELNELNIEKEIAFWDTFGPENIEKLSREEIPWTDGKKHRTTRYKYYYWGEEFDSLKELNKKGYWTKKPIYFETILDLIPYYPYVATEVSWSQDKEYVVICSHSSIEEEYLSGRRYGCDNTMNKYYSSKLQRHYIDIVNKYYNKDGREFTKTLPLIDGKIYLNEAIDYNWPIEVKQDRHDWIWSSPKVIDYEKGIIDGSCVWPGEDVKELTITYVVPRK